MSDFVIDGLPIPTTKSDLSGVPGGQDPNKWWAAADANKVSTYLGSLQAAARGRINTVTVNASAGAVALSLPDDTFVDIALDGNATINAPSLTSGSVAASRTKGTHLYLCFTQDATGYRSVTFNAAFKLPPLMMRQGPGQVSTVHLVQRADGTWRLVSHDAIMYRRGVRTDDAFGVALDVATTSTPLTANTTACQKALDWQKAQCDAQNPAKLVWPCGGAIRINSTLVQRGNSAMAGANVGEIPQGPNFDGGAARFEWWGANNGTMWFTEGCNKGIMEDLAFYGNDKAGCGVEYSGSTYADRSIPAATSGYVTRRCRFVNMKPGVAGNACIKIGTDPSLTGGGTTQFSEAGWYQCDFTGESPGAVGFTYAGLAVDAIKFMCTGNTKNFTFDRIGCTVANHFMNGFGSGYCLMKNFSVGDVKYGFTGGGTVRLEGGDFECGNVPDFRLVTGGNFADRIAITDTEVFAGVAPSSGHTLLIETGANLILENNEFAICAAGDVTGTRIHFEIRCGGCQSRNNLYLGFDDLPHAPLFDGTGNPAFPTSLEYPRFTQATLDSGYLTNSTAYSSFSSTGDRCSAGSGANEIPMVDYTRGLEPQRSVLKIQDLGSDFGRPVALHEGQNRNCFAAFKVNYNMVKSRIQSTLFSQGAILGPTPHLLVKRVWCQILTPFAGVTGVTCSVDTDQSGNANIMAACDPTQAANTMLGIAASELGHIMKPGDALYNPFGYYFLPPSPSYNDTVRLSFTSPSTALSSLSAGELLIFIDYAWFGHV